MVDADRLELELYRRHDHHHLLDHRRRLRRRRAVHGLLRLPLPPPARAAGPPTSRRTSGSNGGSTIGTGGRRRGDAGAGPLRLEPVRHGPGRRDRGRGRRPAMAVELPPARARTAGSAPSDTRNVSADNPLGLDPRRSARAGRRHHRGRRTAPAGRQAGQGAAPLHRRPARFLRAGVPRQDGHDARHGHLFLVHPDADRHLRGPLRRALRRRPPARCAAASWSKQESDYQAWLRAAADLRPAREPRGQARMRANWRSDTE